MVPNSMKTALESTILKKIVMAVTGLLLTLFVIAHMTGNLSFIFGGSDAYNLYTYKLASFGPLLYLIEIILLIAFLAHAWNAVIISRHNKKARPDSYKKLKTTGAPSKKSSSSVSMIYTGIILLVFTAIHLKTFKYGPYYTTTVDGTQMRDLYKLVAEVFRSPLYTWGYVITMLLLGFHLRHGFWSAFQSLGINHPRYSNLIYSVGVLLAIVLAFGFLAVPITVYFTG